ncbi:hypothetical protein FA15DRAFT_647990 [Coprinopsis marcescibilis]|uniref:Uncharacterized protein n=1 Tax=Coprinopsis marcescibilis TaxID=230819 RepID=A0A5C3KIB0_COPMA|nr:hypothetical protein FA15DRAFT_647990 [Coprinopsis marcescibilis]
MTKCPYGDVHTANEFQVRLFKDLLAPGQRGPRSTSAVTSGVVSGYFLPEFTRSNLFCKSRHSMLVSYFYQSLLLCLWSFQASAGPTISLYHARALANNTVTVNGPESYCLIVPKDQHTDIGDSEYPGGTTTYCSKLAKYDSSQGELPPGFWTNVDHVSGPGVNGGRYTQLTGCINPNLVDRLNPEDQGGQYDSSGGPSGIGNPEYSLCIGYNHYVELLEPLGPRACIRCCDDPDDCPTKLDRSGCPAVIPGNYFDCD